VNRDFQRYFLNPSSSFIGRIQATQLKLNHQQPQLLNQNPSLPPTPPLEPHHQLNGGVEKEFISKQYS